MDKFKVFYNEKNGKMILFFGFYFIFFIFLGIFLLNSNNKKTTEIKEDDTKTVEKITTYDISNLINNNYSYSIIINDDDQEINFSGYKNAVDYANYENKYFLDIYNINQLIKKSKFIDSNNLVLSYELNNSAINDVLLTKKEEGINKVNVIVNDKGEVEKILMDLSNYMGKEIYKITINYQVGEINENSPS